MAESVIDHILVSHLGGHAETFAETLPHDLPLVAACGSDHAPVVIDLLVDTPPSQRQRTTMYNPRLERLQDAEAAKAYAEFFAAAIAGWEEMLQCTRGLDPKARIDIASEYLTYLINTATEIHLGLRRVVIGRNITIRWRRKSTARLIEKRRKAQARHKRHPSPQSELRVQQLRARVIDALNEDIRIYHQRRISRINHRFKTRTLPKEMFKLIYSAGELQQDRVPPSAVRDPHTDAVSDSPPKVAQAFANFLHDLGQDNGTGVREARTTQAKAAVSEFKEAAEMLPDQDYNAELSPGEVAVCLRAMKRGKAPGLDKVPAELLQSSGEAGLAMMTDLLNMAFTTQTFPTQWRVGSVVPVFKKGDRSECGNYRPITLLRTLDKLYASTLSRKRHYRSTRTNMASADIKGQRRPISILSLPSSRLSQAATPYTSCHWTFGKPLMR
jgi:hypothetical protein